MRTPPDYRAIAAAIGVDPRALPTLLDAAERSWERLAEARRHLAIELPPSPRVAIFALGSLGRLEASIASDLDLAVIVRDADVPDDDDDAARDGDRLRAEAAARLRGLGFAVADKTFARALDQATLLRDIGGRMDTNEHLTHRALLLTEGAWLAAPATCRAVWDDLFRAYTGGAIASGRFLSALANDLQRYYRTICVDYRFKVEVAGKGWALRNLKLRHSRKLWHLANLVLFSWAATVGDDEREALVGEHLARPPLARLAEGLTALGGAPLCGPLFLAYERFLAAIADPARREHLDRLDHDHREASTTYRELRANADRLDEAAQAIVGHLWARGPEYLIRFGLL